MNNFLFERFNPTNLYNWESRSYREEGEKLIQEVEKLKKTDKLPEPIEGWIHNLKESEEEDSMDTMEI